MKTFDTSHGEVIINNAMIDIDGTNLESGVNIKLDNKTVIELIGHSEDDFELNNVEELLNTL